MGAAVLLILGMLLSGCSFRSTETEAAQVTFFEAGKADAALLQSDGAVVLVDTGLEKNSEDLVEALQEMGVEKIDILILSHFDKDHIGGAASVLESFDVGAVYQSNCPKESDEYEAYLEALEKSGIEPVTVQGETISLTAGGISLTVQGPEQETYDEDPSNNSSLIVTAEKDETAVLFAGDAQDDRMAEFLETFRRPEGQMILKMPYHGHWQEMLPAFLAAVQPDVTVISCSRTEPDEEELLQTVSLLESAESAVRMTYDGNITYTF